MAHATETTHVPAGPLTLHGHDVEGVNRCVHCGLCLAYCPTFSLLGTEMDSPRGRIFLIKSMAEGRIGLSDRTVEHLDLCLGCRACETVCPSGVPYGQLIEAARADIERQRPGGPLRRLFRWLNFSVLLPHPRLLALAASGLRFYQVSGLQRLMRASGLIRLLPAPLPTWEPLLPTLPPRADRAPLPAVTPAQGAKRATVGLLTGCIQQVAFGPHNRATARVLAKNGVEVVAPRAQACCGALHAHAGEHDTALELARKTIQAFESAGVEQVVVNTSGCGAHMKAYGTLLAGDPGLGRARGALRRAGQRRVRVPRARAPARAAPPGEAHRHLPRSLPRRPRPEDPEAAARAARADPRAHGGRAARGRLVLRLGGHLQPHPARDGGAAAGAQGAEHPCHRRRRGGDRQSRLHHPDRAGPGRGRSPCRCSTSSSCSTRPTGREAREDQGDGPRRAAAADAHARHHQRHRHLPLSSRPGDLRHRQRVPASGR